MASFRWGTERTFHGCPLMRFRGSIPFASPGVGKSSRASSAGGRLHLISSVERTDCVGRRGLSEHREDFPRLPRDAARFRKKPALLNVSTNAFCSKRRAKSLQRCCAGNNFSQLGGDLRLTRAIKIALQRSTKSTCIISGCLHRNHAHHILADDRIIQGLKERNFHRLWQ